MFPWISERLTITLNNIYISMFSSTTVPLVGNPSGFCDKTFLIVVNLMGKCVSVIKLAMKSQTRRDKRTDSETCRCCWRTLTSNKSQLNLLNFFKHHLKQVVLRAISMNFKAHCKWQDRTELKWIVEIIRTSSCTNLRITNVSFKHVYVLSWRFEGKQRELSLYDVHYLISNECNVIIKSF